MDDLLGKMIGECSKNFKKRMDFELEKKGIPTSYVYIIHYLEKNQNEVIVQSDICDFLSYKASSVSATLTNMENDGLISRTKDINDGRKLLISFTKKGIEKSKEIKELFIKIESEISDVFSKEDKDIFIGYINKMNSVLERR